MNRIEFDKGLLGESPSSTLLHPAQLTHLILVNVMEPFWSKDSFRLDAEDCSGFSTCSETQSKMCRVGSIGIQTQGRMRKAHTNPPNYSSYNFGGHLGRFPPKKLLEHGPWAQIDEIEKWTILISFGVSLGRMQSSTSFFCSFRYRFDGKFICHVQHGLIRHSKDSFSAPNNRCLNLFHQ